MDVLTDHLAFTWSKVDKLELKRHPPFLAFLHLRMLLICDYRSRYLVIINARCSSCRSTVSVAVVNYYRRMHDGAPTREVAYTCKQFGCFAEVEDANDVGVDKFSSRHVQLIPNPQHVEQSRVQLNQATPAGTSRHWCEVNMARYHDNPSH